MRNNSKEKRGQTDVHRFFPSCERTEIVERTVSHHLRPETLPSTVSVPTFPALARICLQKIYDQLTFFLLRTCQSAKKQIEGGLEPALALVGVRLCVRSRNLRSRACASGLGRLQERLSQPCVLCLGFLQDGDVDVGIFPKGKKVFVGG